MLSISTVTCYCCRYWEWNIIHVAYFGYCRFSLVEFYSIYNTELFLEYLLVGLGLQIENWGITGRRFVIRCHLQWRISKQWKEISVAKKSLMLGCKSIRCDLLLLMFYSMRVCVSICWSQSWPPTKTAEPHEVIFGVWTRVAQETMYWMSAWIPPSCNRQFWGYLFREYRACGQQTQCCWVGGSSGAATG